MKWIKWEVWLVRVQYEGSNKTIDLPFVIYGKKEGKLLLFRATNNPRQSDWAYRLTQYVSAGLHYNSNIIVSERYNLQEIHLVRKKGMLAGSDIVEIEALYKEFCELEKYHSEAKPDKITISKNIY